MHAGGDDRSPLAGLSGKFINAVDFVADSAYGICSFKTADLS